MSANTISALFFLCTGYAVVKERLLYSVPALVCAISHEFFVYLIAAVFLQYPLTSLRSGGMQYHCTDCCKIYE